MRLSRILFTLIGLIFTTQVSAVALNAGKEGQVLIFPYYSNLGGNHTLIQITRPLQGIGATDPRALKVHFRDRNGLAVLSFNLYLAEEMWSAAISLVNGQSQLELPNNSCTVPQLKQPGSNAVVVPLTSGFFEVIDMGSIVDQSTKDAANSFDCDGLEAMWAEGGVWRNEDPGFQLAPPQGRLRGTTQLINIQEGTLYSIVATALTEFSDIPQHTGPESETPNLSTPHDAGTASGNTQSTRCFRPYLQPTKSCIVDTWARPKDAVAAVLSTNELRGEYTNNDEIAAKAELILTFPLQPYREMNDWVPWLIMDIGGIHDASGPICAPILSIPPCSGDYDQSVEEAVFLASFNDSRDDFGNLIFSEILKDGHTAFFPEPIGPLLPVASSFGAYMRRESGLELISNSGTRYPGDPVIGYILQKYSNGQLTNQEGEVIKANYGNAFELSQKGN